MFIVAMIAALSISSCKLSKSIEKTKETTLDHRDSISYTKVVKLDTAVFEERNNKLEAMLQELIEKGEISNSSNGVKTIIKYRDSTITAECICERVEKLVISSMEKWYQNQKTNKEVIQQEAIKEVVIKQNWTAILILSGLLIFIIVFIILKSKLW